MKIFVEVHTTIRGGEYEQSGNFGENESDEIVWDHRHNRKLERLIKQARFRYQASFDQIDFSLHRNLDKNMLLRFSNFTTPIFNIKKIRSPFLRFIL